MSPDVTRIEKTPRMATARRWLKPSKRARRRAEMEQAELEQSRTVVRVRSQGWCEARVGPGCTQRGQHVHHRLMRSQGGSHDPSNLMMVCLRCHSDLHSNPNMAYARGLLLRRNDA